MHQGSHIIAEGSGLSVEAIAASGEATVPHSTWLVRLEEPLRREPESTAIAGERGPTDLPPIGIRTTA